MELLEESMPAAAVVILLYQVVLISGGIVNSADEAVPQ